MALDLDKIDLGGFGINKEEAEQDDTDIKLRANFNEAAKINPDEHAKTVELSRQSGVPEFAVKSNPAEVESKLKLDKIDFGQMSKRSPNTAKYLVEPNNTVIAQDDVDVLESIENTLMSSFAAIGPYDPRTAGKKSVAPGFTAESAEQTTLDRLKSADIPRTVSAPRNFLQGVTVSPEGYAEVDILSALKNRYPEQAEVQKAIDAPAEQLPESDIGRLETAGSQFVRGITGVLTSVPKTLSVESAASTKQIMLNTPGGNRLYMAASGGDPVAALALSEFNRAHDPRITHGYQAAKRMDNFIEKTFEVNPEYTEEFFAGQLPQGLGSTIGFLAVTTVTRGTGVLGGAGAGYAANAQSQFEDALASGASIDDATKASRLAGVVGVSEVLPISTLLDKLDKGTGGSIKRAIKEALKQGTEEAIQESMQTIWSNVIASDLVKYDPERKVFTGATEAGGAGFTVGALMTTIGFMLTPGRNRGATQPTVNEVQTEVEQNQLQKLHEDAGKSKLRQRDKEAFRQFVEQADGDNNTHVFIDGAQAALYLQGKKAEEIDADPALKLLAEQAREASATGSDIQIPVADFAAEIAGTPHFEALRDSMTMSDQTTAPFRQEQAKQEQETYIKSLMDTAQENASEYVEAQEIYTKVRDQLVDTGQVTPANASVMAQIVPAWATAQARRSGKTVQQVYEEAGLTIEGPQTGKRAKLEAEQVLEQQQPKIVIPPAPTPKSVNVNPDEAWADHHAQMVKEEQLTPEQAKVTAPKPDIDDLTGLYSDNELLSAVTRAQASGEQYVYVESDTFNLGGMNKALGANVRSDEVLKQIAQAYSAAFAGIPTYRRGAGRFGVIVPVDYNVSESLAKLEESVTSIIQANQLEEIEAPKVAGAKGVSLYSGYSLVSPSATLDDIVGSAQQQIEAVMPRGEDNVNRIETFQTWVTASAEQPGGVAARVAEANRQGGPGIGKVQGATSTEALERADVREPDPATDSTIAPDVVKQEEFNRAAQKVKLNPEQASVFAPYTHRDPLTGWFTARDQKQTIARAQQYVEETGGDAVYVVADISNLGGLNLALGSQVADVVFRNMAQIVDETLRTIDGVQVVPFRHGGDEISFVLTNASIESAREVMNKAAAQVSGYIDAAGLRDLPHAKDPTNPARNGSGIYVGVQQIDGIDASIYDIIDAADARVEVNKKRPLAKPVPVQLKTPEMFAQPAYHGTHARDIEKFSLEFVGTGEGAQAQGFGLYFASQQDIAEFYRESVSGASREIINVSIGDIPFYKNGSPVDYSPRDRSNEESARAKFVEDVLINEWELRQAIDEGRGEEYLKESLQDQIDSLTDEREYNLDDTVYYDESIAYLEKYLDKNIKIESKELGQVYEVEVPDDSELYDWDASIDGNVDLMQVAEVLVGEERIAEVLEQLEENASMGFTDVEDAFESALLTNDLDALEKIKDFIEDADAIAEFEKLKDEIGFDFDIEADTGQSVYETLASRFGEAGVWDVEGQKQASHVMQQAGYKGHKYLDARSRDPETDMPSYNYVIWDEESIQIRDVFYQQSFLQGKDGKRQPRGYYEPANSIIRLTEAADLSTFLHEFAHFMYEMEVNGNTEMLQSINGWYKRNAKDVAREANSYLADKFDAEKQLEQPATLDMSKEARLKRAEALGFDTSTVYYVSVLKDTKQFDKTGKFMGYTGTAGISVTDNPELASRYLDRYGAFGWVDGKPNQPFEKNVIPVYIKKGRVVKRDAPYKVSVPMGHPLPEGFVSQHVKEGYDTAVFQDSISRRGPVKHSDAKNAIRGEEWVLSDPSQIRSINAAFEDAESAELLAQPQQPPTAKAGTITEADVITFLDQTTTGDKDKDAAIRRAVHEQFARGFEAYLMEGKAPSIELRNAFRTFARWLANIYRNLRGQLKVNLDDEMRAVFDRLLATEEQIQAAEGRAQVEPMFTDAAMAGMTDEEFADYQKRQEKVKDIQSETLRDKLIQQLTRQTKAWWKEEKQDFIDEETERLSKEQVYTARARLRDGDMKLDHATVKEMVGEAKTNKLGRTSIAIPPKLIGMTAKGQQGVHPDEAAVFFGYRSGSEMLNDLIKAPSIKEEAETAAEARMVEKHGDILNDGTIEKEADEAVQNEERGKLLLHELKFIAKGTKVPKIDAQTIKSVAEERIGRLAFREIHPGKYRRAEIKAAQEAARMLTAGNKEGAAQAKMRQVMNYYLGMVATNAKNDTMKIVDRMARYNKKKVREEIQKAEGGYWDQINKILNRFEFRKSATLKQVESINTWMKERMEIDGDGLVLSNAVLNETYVTHWKNVPFSDLQGINDSVKNIEHVARYANKLTRMQEEIDFNKLVDRMVTSAEEKVKTRFKSKRTDVAEGRNWGRWLMAQMTKIPFLTSWMDGGERAGLWHQALVQPFTEAYNAEIKLWEKVGKPVMDLITNRKKEDIKRHNRKVYIPEIDDNLYGHQILAVALNTGNAGNLKKLLLGEGWANPENDAEITFDNPKLQAVLSYMTREDWQMVQQIWDQMDTLYPELAEVHRRTTGLIPPKVEATPVKTSYGTFKGGYYPVKYDPNRDHKAALNEDKLNAEVESMFSNGASIQASVNAGATNERTGYYAPIRLSLDVVPSHFQEVIHYITHHDPVREVNRLIRNKRIATVMKEKLGPEEYAQMKPWLNSIAKDGREAPTKMFWDDMLQRLRFGVTLGTMGFKASTGIIQISGLSNSIAEVGMAPMMQAMRSILGSPTTMKQAWGFAVENSQVMAHRAKTMDREIKNAMTRLEGKRGILAAVQEVSMKHIALIQTYMVDLPTWHAAYIKGMKDWGDETRAFQYADWAIENVQGSGATKDLARILRGQTETGRMFTMFMTFFSSLWNMERDIVKGARSGRYSTTNLAAKAMFLFTLPVLFEMMMRGELGEPDDGDDDRLQQMLTKIALYPLQSVPFVRDIANATTGEFGYNISPLQSIIEQGTRTIPAIVTSGFTDEEITKGQAKGATKFAGAALGIPGMNQIWATGEHLYSVIEEGEEFTFRELLFGPDRE